MAVPSPACSAVLGTTELRGHIVDFLRASEDDLKSCALVSRAFTFLAQGHLFHTIRLHPAGERFDYNIDAVIRLREILQTSPHLRPLVRAVHAAIDREILAQCEQMRLPCVRELTLVTVPTRFPVLGAAQNLLALPSLRTLCIDTFLHSGLSGLEPVFARCTPGLRTLRIHCVSLSDGGVLHHSSIPAAPSVRAQITDLALVRSPQLGAWLLDAQCPLDLSCLRTLEANHTASPALAAALEPAYASIEVLRLHARAYLSSSLSLSSRNAHISFL
ncbi:hypothetical protein B0H17DRAFT_126048 [Mycena rosella]|uniref:F-box domain-containing protein n=1 Tax=Mycena rosella TaxID=1033263 RepID=A0AAD7D3N1_MYCRO|nr:hypothetical protein B0H17DRAFT_126048 [Mycena rosella]